MPRPPKNKMVEQPPMMAPPVQPIHQVQPVPAMQPLPQAPIPGQAPGPVQPRVIDVENYIRVRDSVYARLSTIQDLIKSFAIDYLRQTNLLLGEGTNLENGDLGNFNLETALSMMPPAGIAVPPVEEKKERKKRQHDPNAPKRPLTPYFLYMQTARPIIAQDLGPDAPKGAVQDEGQRRWSTMDAEEKNGWDRAYRFNMRLYNARTHSYKSGNTAAREMNDEDADDYATKMGIPVPEGASYDNSAANNEQAAIAEQLRGATTGADDDEDDEDGSAGKASKGKKDSRKRKSTANTPAAESESKPSATPASPENKKRKRTTKAADQAQEEPKKSSRKKGKSG